jgi:hypothetical protein
LLFSNSLGGRRRAVIHLLPLALLYVKVMTMLLLLLLM